MIIATRQIKIKQYKNTNIHLELKKTNKTCLMANI